MKINKINHEEPTIVKETEGVNFKAIKLNRSTGPKLRKAITKDTIELRKNLPDNKLAKDKKYFGNSEIGGCGGSNECDNEQAVKFIIGLGAAIAALAMM